MLNNVPGKGVPYSVETLREGQYFSTGQYNSDVSAGSSVTFLIRNPSNSGKRYYIDPQVIRTELKSRVNKWFNPDSLSGGSNPTTSPINKKSNGEKTTDAVVEVNHSSFTGGSEQFSSKLVGSDAGGPPTGGGGAAPANIIYPGNSLFLEVVNEANSSQDISIDLDWVEEST